MENSQALSPLRESDYEAIEAAVMETEKGRWFLFEYARRHRSADTDQVMGAIGRLETLLRRERRPDADRIRLDIGEMKDAIERTKLEIAQIKSDGRTPLSRFDRASSELDAIVEQTEAATSEILGSAEKIQEFAWTMREAGVDNALCDEIENLTTNIYMACSFQDLTGQRTQKVVQVLRYLENRINAMIEIWGMDDDEVHKSSADRRVAVNAHDHRPDAHLLNGPALAGEGIEQHIVDDLLVEDADADRAALDAVAHHAIDEMDFDRIDAMTALDTAPSMVGADGQIDFDAIPTDEDMPQDAASLADSIDFDTIETDEAPQDAAALADSIDFDAIEPEDAPQDAAALADSIDFDAIEPAEDQPKTAAELADSIDFDAVQAAPDEPEAGDEPSDEALAIASEAVDTAIEALKEVSDTVRQGKDTDDPFDQMTKAERQALFS
ncbi:chemotaxis protein [Pleomorphomonas diazotrophica]|uniref:Chemotaxis protein n=1 Tax=Pleomorphomonas diazotrophica TaxID=1166257 RepID=A0A1I4R7D5_9HYPH|nr:protein phosphatase CheZ [Pleomorphomonas diazotrophica]PKR90142.1 chemotaxis protein [Pleomorphomonas diazotrophica]SFM48171.1 Chemotaxis phosphatase, CheZ [Pleomorphomonas diazotrophica]